LYKKLNITIEYDMSITVQQDVTMYSLLYFCKLLYMFRVVTPLTIRSTTVITTSGTGHTVSATFRYGGEVGTSKLELPRENFHVGSSKFFTIAEGSRDGLTSARCCIHSYMCS
jgi:hypothetical protein